MKKTISLAFILLFGPLVSAQDTISDLPENYFYNYWNPYMLQNIWGLWGYRSNSNHPGLVCDNTLGLHADKPMTIYGIAVSLISPLYYTPGWNTNPYTVMQYCDTSFDNTYTDVGLYEFDSDSGILTVVDQKRVHIKHSPVRHWLEARYNNELDLNHIPLYEVYFANSYTVQDSFFVGITMQSYARADDGRYLAPGITATFYLSHNFCNNFILKGRDSCSRYVPYEGIYEYPMIFPILTPSPYGDDTVETDTTAVDSTMSVAAAPPVLFVSLQPNPATGSVRIGATGGGPADVHIVDMQGRTVLRRSGAQMPLNVGLGGWPRGVYSVSVRTSAGTVARRLVVK